MKAIAFRVARDHPNEVMQFEKNASHRQRGASEAMGGCGVCGRLAGRHVGRHFA